MNSIQSHISKTQLDYFRILEVEKDKCLRKFNKKFTKLRLEEDDPIPSWITRLFAVQDRLFEAISEYEIDHNRSVPEFLTKSLEECRLSINQIAQKISAAKFIECLRQKEEPYVDDHRLLISRHYDGKTDKNSSLSPIPTNKLECSLNLGLLMTIYRKTNDPEMKKFLSTLAVNYLAKVSPITFQEMNFDKDSVNELENSFQHGILARGMTYNREYKVFERYFQDKIKAARSPLCGNNVLLADCADFEDLLQVMFTPIRSSSVEKCSKDIASALEKHLRNHDTDYLQHYMQSFLTIDLTDQLGSSILTFGDEEKNQAFEKLQATVEEQIAQGLKKAIEALRVKFPQIIKNGDDEKRLSAFIKINLIPVCRTEVFGIGVLNMLRLFSNGENYHTPVGSTILGVENRTPEQHARQLISKRSTRINVELDDFLSLTGLRLSSMKGKSQLFDVMSLEELLQLENTPIVEFSGHGKNALYFKEKTDFTNKQLVKDFITLCSSKTASPNNAHLAILGQCTGKLMLGVMKEIGDEQWIALNERWETRMILQTTLFRILQHIAQVTMEKDNFGLTAKCMELIQQEISSLLLLTMPFKKKDFEKIYSGRLTEIPKQLQKLVQPGVAKSAMNVLSGLWAVAKQTSEDPIIVHDPSSHFESVEFLGKDNSIEKVLADKTKKRVDLYLGEFNYNVNLHPDHNHYQGGDLIKAVETLLKNKSETKHLTVAVDCTIDYVNSKKVRQLLEHFSKEILEGKLNFVIFRSGQKFDLMGFDNYYGSPFYMINNGEEQWKPYNRLKKKESHKTDDHSLQWFSLLNKYAPETMDEYRRIIFANTRWILDKIPENLKPGKHASIKIPTVDSAVDSCYIDIKLKSKTWVLPLVSEVERIIFNTFAERGKKIHARGGYGFYHPNVSFMRRGGHQEMDEYTVRINPGLDEQETNLIIEVIQKIAEL